MAAEDMNDISTVLSSIMEESRLDKKAYNDENANSSFDGLQFLMALKKEYKRVHTNGKAAL
ncbi:hypothetical protein FH972_016551 [Carpinus fangiana]|uniref:Uncharacterized protein n=1 Tax=Carpinus fangiana TaxID=176857 RepID=A0A5N6RG87_9ROSI|nr:hypothetical protein FH972_016551 [Carpinus fangiana]